MRISDGRSVIAYARVPLTETSTMPPVSDDVRTSDCGSRTTVRFSHPVVVHPREIETHGVPAIAAMASGVTSLPSLICLDCSGTPSMLNCVTTPLLDSVKNAESEAAMSMTPGAKIDATKRGAVDEATSYTSTM